MPVASRVGGVTEVLRDTNAFRFTCAPNDVTEFVEKLIVVSSLDPSEVKDLGYGLRDYVLKRLNSHTIERRLLDLFDGIAGLKTSTA